MFTTGRTVEVVEPITRHDGDVAHFHTTKVPLRSSTGEIVGTVGTSHRLEEQAAIDASEAARRERKSSLEMLRRLIERLPIIGAVVDAKLRVVATTRSFREAFALESAGEGKELEGLVPVPDILQATLARAVDAGAGGAVNDLALAGTERRYDIRVSPWVLPTDQTGGALVVWTDVTQLRAAERALASANDDLREINTALESERRKVDAHRRELDALVDSLSSGAIVTDRIGGVAVCNREAEQLLGTSRGELPSRGWIEHLGLRDPEGKLLEGADHPLHRAGQGTSCRDELAQVKLGDGTSDRWLLVSAAPLPESSRYQAVMTLADVTSRIRTQRELEEFAYVASHDLREPLRMVTSYLGLLGESLGGKLDDETREYMRFATDGAERMTRLIRSLLDFSRSGATALSVEPVALGEVMTEIEQEFDELLRGAEARLTYEGLPTIAADRSQLKQLLANLISNAVKFRHPERSPQINVSAQPHGQAIRVEVADNGIGFDIKYAPKAFKMFQRLHSGQAYGGTGIGLAICKRVVERHGGTLGVESEVGVGSRFWFTLAAESNTHDGNAD